MAITSRAAASACSAAWRLWPGLVAGVLLFALPALAAEQVRVAGIAGGTVSTSPRRAEEIQPEKELPSAADIARLGQPHAIVSPMGTRIESPDDQLFRAGQRNILLIHGLFGEPAGLSGLTEFLLSECANVMLYQYPSGRSIADNGETLRLRMMSLLRFEPDLRFDVVGYSMGGLVARYAREQTGPFGNRIDNVITLGSPHTGAVGANIFDFFFGPGPATPESLSPGVSDMKDDSAFLRGLNQSPVQGSTRYFFLAGEPQPNRGNDGVVSVRSALADGVPLRLAGSAHSCPN